jgi:thiol-disulfide isomerase/thioredoxin
MLLRVRNIGNTFFRIFLIVTLIVPPNKANAQGKVKELSVGDTIPDIELKNILNYKTNSLWIKDFEGKLLILDFWATWCSPCIGAFAKIDTLQKKFSGKVQFLPVTAEETSTVKSFLEKLFTAKRLLFPTVTADEVLGKLFKHTYLPHYVWINKNRKIVAISETKEINERNIQAVLENKPVFIPVKRDNKSKVFLESGKPVFGVNVQEKSEKGIELRKLNDSSLLFSSLLTKYVEGLSSGVIFDSNVVTISNRKIKGLYQVAFWGNNLAVLNSANTIVEIPDSLLFEMVTGQRTQGRPHISPGLESLAWLRENGFCYEIKVPSSLSNRKFDIMLDDFNHYFGTLYGLQGVVENRKRAYLALVSSKNNDKIVSKGGPPIAEADKFSIRVQNQDITFLINKLALALQSEPPISDETEYKGKVDIYLGCDLSNFEKVNSELKKIGLELVRKEQLSKVGVIRLKKLIK